jgi:hypothetical protein
VNHLFSSLDRLWVAGSLGPMRRPRRRRRLQKDRLIFFNDIMTSDQEGGSGEGGRVGGW